MTVPILRKMSSVPVSSSLGQVGRSQIEGKTINCVNLLVSVDYCISDVVPQTPVAYTTALVAG